MEAAGSERMGTPPGAMTPHALLDAVIEMCDDAIFTCDVQMAVTTWSATAERLFGRPAAAVLGGPFATLFSRHLREEVESVFANVIKGDRVRHFETEVSRPDGMPLPVSLSLCPVLDTGHQPVGAVVIARDVTEQHLVQATLAEIDARTGEGEALAHIGSWLWDVRTGTVQWSAEFYRILGVDPLEFDGTFESHLGLIHPEDRDHVRAAMVQSVESGRPFNGEYRVVRPDQEIHIVQVRAQPTFGSTGKSVGLRGIGQDVTPSS